MNQPTTEQPELKELSEIIRKIVWGVWMVGPTKAPSWAEDTIEPVEPEEAVEYFEELFKSESQSLIKQIEGLAIHVDEEKAGGFCGDVVRLSDVLTIIKGTK